MKIVKSIAFIMVTGTLIFSACKKKKEETPVKTEPVKTLNKATLTDNKTWESTNPTITFIFKSNGDCGVGGKWRWLRSSDTMEMDDDGSGVYLKWKFYYNTDKEMKCRWINNEQDIVFAIKP